MTLDEMVAQVAERLNLTSDTALTRIAADINERYRWVLGAIGLPTASQGVVTADTIVDYRYVEFTGCHKLLSVFNADGQVLPQRTFQELRMWTPHADPPSCYAIASQSYDSTTIWLDCTPSSIYTLSADALVDAATLDGDAQPQFDSMFHDILVYGAQAIELRKLEKESLADDAEGRFEKRLSELRMFIAKSAYLDIVQGGAGNRWAGRALQV